MVSVSGRVVLISSRFISATLRPEAVRDLEPRSKPCLGRPFKKKIKVVRHLKIVIVTIIN